MRRLAASILAAGIILIAIAAPVVQAIRIIDASNDPTVLDEFIPRPSPMMAPSPPDVIPVRPEPKPSPRDEVMAERIVRAPSPSPVGATTVSATAYCLTGTMANGEAVYDGAVASNLWPLGTELYIHELGRSFTVADRVGHSSELDVAMPGRCDDAIGFGRRSLTVSVIS